ncbi:MAG: hypothetical protein Q9171_006444 [Xanthocarpia ochracea]
MKPIRAHPSLASAKLCRAAIRAQKPETLSCNTPRTITPLTSKAVAIMADGIDRKAEGLLCPLLTISAS